MDDHSARELTRVRCGAHVRVIRWLTNAPLSVRPGLCGGVFRYGAS
jgi:hypothetical protein